MAAHFLPGGRDQALPTADAAGTSAPQRGNLLQPTPEHPRSHCRIIYFVFFAAQWHVLDSARSCADVSPLTKCGSRHIRHVVIKVTHSQCGLLETVTVHESSKSTKIIKDIFHLQLLICSFFFFFYAFCGLEPQGFLIFLKNQKLCQEQMSFYQVQPKTLTGHSHWHKRLQSLTAYISNEMVLPSFMSPSSKKITCHLPCICTASNRSAFLKRAFRSEMLQRWFLFIYRFFRRVE